MYNKLHDKLGSYYGLLSHPVGGFWDTVIQVENLGKKYIIGHQQPDRSSRYVALRDVLADGTRSVFRSECMCGCHLRWRSIWIWRFC